MTIDPQVAAVLASASVAVLSVLPSFHRALRRQRRALRECVRCGRSIVFGERTCDCTPVE